MGEEKNEKEKTWPPWLNPLLTATFFLPCKFHGNSTKNECNMYCLDCMNGALCTYCLVLHREHHVIQIRRSSYHDVIRVSEIQKVLDISGVQTYIINSARVVFLNERPQPQTQSRPGKGLANTCKCKVCDRSLLDTFSFCSLGCKFAGIAIPPGTHRRKPMLQQQNSKTDSPFHQQKYAEKNTSKLSDDHNEEYMLHCISPPTPPLAMVNYRSTKRRKGIPQRAPMGIC
ncbi:hypothetical protein MRB53_015279 [Persea americana]|uniref:Uncharacterized protein n=1 Tax=Persea americana TaxID=3435 RepID=A0ACC2KDV6_PERAE|nr:hypothetical protein MRB53_015279 [Persea americana]|eukprot:TRINITY_DN54204_c0_g1_i1.p1 TRINITY_DN54204_c0_g1~~TRINITY_DN54204_c0_g1_i1.p1  ORF type:complete len:229 (-),score=32.10 TRINITY_DN54204_c0_g1_i1:180-866(-)